MVPQTRQMRFRRALFDLLPSNPNQAFRISEDDLPVISPSEASTEVDENQPPTTSLPPYSPVPHSIPHPPTRSQRCRRTFSYE